MGVVMSRVGQITPEKAQAKVKNLYATIQEKLGRIPNIFLNMGNSPAVLEGYLSFSEAVGRTSLTPQLREQIALAVGEANRCNYCLSAHTMIAQNTGLAEQEILQARQGQAKDSKAAAILKFAKKVVELRGHLSNADIASLKAAGVTDTELVEIMMVISLNMFTNYFNHITDPKVDFPEAPAL